MQQTLFYLIVFLVLTPHSLAQSSRVSTPEQSANPTQTTAEIAFSTSAPSEVTVSAVDMLGRYVVTTSMSTLGEGAHRQHVDLSHAAPGVYVIRVALSQGNAAPSVTALPVTVIR